MALIIFMFCLLLAIHDYTSVEAGKIGFIAKHYKERAKRIMECCVKLKCFEPDSCHGRGLGPKSCLCLKHIGERPPPQ